MKAGFQGESRVGRGALGLVCGYSVNYLRL